jgi:hypothetical protein
MSTSVVVLVRIAVRVPQALLPMLAPEGLSPCCGSCSQPDVVPVTPLVTAEMLTFYQEHPDNN